MNSNTRGIKNTVIASSPRHLVQERPVKPVDSNLGFKMPSSSPLHTVKESNLVKQPLILNQKMACILDKKQKYKTIVKMFKKNALETMLKENKAQNVFNTHQSETTFFRKIKPLFFARHILLDFLKKFPNLKDDFVKSNNSTLPFFSYTLLTILKFVQEIQNNINPNIDKATVYYKNKFSISIDFDSMPNSYKEIIEYCTHPITVSYLFIICEHSSRFNMSMKTNYTTTAKEIKHYLESLLKKPSSFIDTLKSKSKYLGSSYDAAIVKDDTEFNDEFKAVTKKRLSTSSKRDIAISTAKGAGVTVVVTAALVLIVGAVLAGVDISGGGGGGGGGGDVVKIPPSLDDYVNIFKYTNELILSQFGEEIISSYTGLNKDLINIILKYLRT